MSVSLWTNGPRQRPSRCTRLQVNNRRCEIQKFCSALKCAYSMDIKDDHGSGAQIDVGGIGGAGCPFRAMHDFYVGGDGGGSLAGACAGAMAGGDGAS